MDAVTYPDNQVAAYIADNFIPLRIQNDKEPYATDFNVKWTPRIVILGPDGKVHQETVGFNRPESFIASLELGLAKVDFDTDCYEFSLKHLARILEAYPKSAAAPEAVFLKGVNEYKQSGSGEGLKKAYEKLQAEYPESEWAERAAPYRLL